MAKEVKIIGGGLAGSEAAYQLAKRGIKVILFEMRPKKMTQAHKTAYLSELVCSNSLKSVDPMNAHGLLKEELRKLDSLLLRIAEEVRIPGGKALVVDREKFSRRVEEELLSLREVELIREEVSEIPEGVTIVATGPLSSQSIVENLKRLVGDDTLHFYDALSPIVDAESLNFSKLYFADRHRYEENSYLNAPLSKEQYEEFVELLLSAEKHPLHEFEKNIPYFEACLPIEELAKRGKDALRYGPMRPTGLKREGKTPYAVLQLRPENNERTAYSLVGFQTQLKIREQERVFRKIPGLEDARFLRYGAVHRNTYFNAPRILLPSFQLKKEKRIFLAGQLTGTEGYVEAIMGGLISGINAFLLLEGYTPIVPPKETMMGALIHYITNADERFFEPMNANFGLFVGAPKNLRGREKRRYFVERARKVLEEWIRRNSFLSS